MQKKNRQKIIIKIFFIELVFNFETTREHMLVPSFFNLITVIYPTQFFL